MVVVYNTKGMQREFLLNPNNVKIKYETFCNYFQNGGLKNEGTYLPKFLAYNYLGLKNYTTKTPITRN